MDRPSSDNLRAGTDRTQHRHIAVGKNNRLTGAHRTFEQQRRWFWLGFRLSRFNLCEHAVASACQQRRHARRDVSSVYALDPKDPNIALFEAGDEMRDSGLAKVYGGQVKHHRLADKEAGRPGERCVYFFKPANDWNSWAKHKRDVRAAPHSNQLTCWRRRCVHGGRLAFLIE